MQLYIIRHGQSLNNTRSDPEQWVIDTPLTETGERQAALLARHLAEDEAYGITRLYCSPMRRALQTTRPLMAALDLSPEVWVAIHEHGGVVSQKNGRVTNHPGLSRRAMSEDFPGYRLPNEVTDSGWWRRAEGIEPLAACYDRACTVAAALAERADRAETVALVTHGTFADRLIKAILDQPGDSGHFYAHYNTAITRIDYEAGRPALRYSNRVAHLPPDLVT